MIKFKIDGQPYEIPDLINIEDYVKIFKVKDLFDEDYFAAKLISIVSGAPLKDLLDAGFDEINYLAAHILNIIPKQEEIKFVDKFELNGVKYGFFPNWRDLTFAEFVDMDTISTKSTDELLDLLHILTAIMYRPIVIERGEHDYDIEMYDVTTMKKRSELFKKELDVKYILGAQFFFIKFAKRFLGYSPRYSTLKIGIWDQIKIIWLMWRMILKMGSVRSLGGFLSLTKSLTMTLQNTNTSIKKTS
jgi:hypothetical protein